MEQRYVLRLYDTDMVSFSLTERGIDGLQAEIFEVNRDRVELLPPFNSIYHLRVNVRI